MPMILAEATLQAAFEQHAQRYGAEKLWEVGYHVACWERADRAFGSDSDADFQWLYGELKNRWQVFRSRHWDPPTPAATLATLGLLPAHLRRRKLADFAALPLAEYQGAALEWLLLGLVELPPAGVVVT